MQTTKSYKKVISTLLVLVFFLPALIKAVHLLYAEHQHEFTLSSNTVEINESHNDCPICEFEFTQIINTENYYKKAPHILVSDIIPLFNNDVLKTSTQISFHLRAPPINS